MADQRRDVDFGENCGEVVIKANGVRIEIHADGSMEAHTHAAVNVHPTPPNEDRLSPVIRTPRVGDTMPDGSVLAGISPVTHKPMYVTPEDAPLSYSFNQAGDYARKLHAHGHSD
jgi:hypothetical protein